MRSVMAMNHPRPRFANPDALLAKTNTPRSERRKLIKALSGGMPGAVTTNDGTPGAAEDIKPETLNSLESALAALVK